MSDDLVDLLLESELNMDHGAWATCREAAVEILRLRAENEKLRAALKPFADEAEYIRPGAHDGDWYDLDAMRIGHIRAAAAALEGLDDE